MKHFRLEEDYLGVFPDSRIGILVCEGINNKVTDPERFAEWLEESQAEAMQYVTEEVFTDNPVIKTWREAFYKFKTKKGARCSIEALLKRVKNGGSLRTINPLVDIYNGISLRYGLPVDGEDIDKFEGDNRLTMAEGTEPFVTYGSNESEPPYPGEIVYKDDAGAICRCFNWRESVRTMLTEDTVNAFMCIETVDGERADVLEKALDHLASMIESELGGKVRKAVLDRNNTVVDLL
ncbi:MAG: B3/4 domain-containing protein [Solobacterium sp.]|nr:B3/4 domain-containing protein [Solobacterium sp.]